MQKSRSSGSEVVDATGSQKSVVLELASRFGTRVVVLGKWLRRCFVREKLFKPCFE